MVFQKKRLNEAIKEEIEERQIVTPQNVIENKSIKPLIVNELPVKTYRKIIDKDTGETFESITVIEALQEILESVREIKKAI